MKMMTQSCGRRRCVNSINVSRMLTSIATLLMTAVVLPQLSTTRTAVFVEGRERAAGVKIGNRYKQHDAVHITVNKIGPFNNPTETYRYYSLPFCQINAEENANDIKYSEKDEIANTEGILQQHLSTMLYDSVIRHGQRLEQDLLGGARETSPYQITFLNSVERRRLCLKTYTPKQSQQFKNAILNFYFYEMFVEDIPMWGYVGEVVEADEVLGDIMDTANVYIYPHLHFHIGYNEDQIVAIQVSTDLSRKVDITKIDETITVEYSYSVEWCKETTEWKDRHSRFAESRFLPASIEIHWMSIILSFVFVLLLTAFLTFTTLRDLKNISFRQRDLNDDALDEEESGWKSIHGDVFRFPTNSLLFCAAVGTGNHLLLLTFCHLSLALSGITSINRRGSITAGFVVLYSLTSFVGGYTSVRLYRQMNGKDWTRCILLTATLFPFPIVCVFMWVNTLAMMYRSTIALPLAAIFTVSVLFLFICLPLTVVGGLMAKQYASDDFNAPTRTTKVAREIPTNVPLFRGRPFRVLVSGCLPFSAIYIELHYIFASIWGHQIYTLFGILFLAFILLVLVTSLITVALVYFQLARQDHRWWWAAYINGGMTGLFIYIYSFYYYFQRSGMNGVLQGSYYFGYMAVVSFAFFLMLGSAAFQFSLIFVKYIYSRIKRD